MVKCILDFKHEYATLMNKSGSFTAKLESNLNVLFSKEKLVEYTFNVASLIDKIIKFVV